MKARIPNNVAAIAIVFTSALFTGCATQPQTTLSLNGQESGQTVVNEKAGVGGVEQVLVSRGENTIVVLTPQKRSELNTKEDLWFSVVAVNKSSQPISFSVNNIAGIVGGEFAKAPSAEEMEKQRKAEVRKGQLWGFATMIAGAALVDNAGGNTDQYMLDTSTFMLEMTQQEGDVTDALISKYDDVVLKEAQIPAKGNHGGLVRFAPPDDPLWYYKPLVVDVDVAGESHRFEFGIESEVHMPE